jgi:hypothetical protein
MTLLTHSRLPTFLFCVARHDNPSRNFRDGYSAQRGASGNSCPAGLVVAVGCWSSSSVSIGVDPWLKLPLKSQNRRTRKKIC